MRFNHPAFVRIFAALFLVCVSFLVDSPALTAEASHTTIAAQPTPVPSNWQQLPTTDQYSPLFKFGPYLFLSNSNGELHRSLDSGQTVVKLIPGLPPGINNPVFTAIGESLFVGATLGVFHSNDLGSTWVSVNNGLSFQDGASSGVRGIAGIVTLGSTLFAVTNSVDTPNVKLKVSIFRSTNLGQNWTEVSAGLAAVSQIAGLVVSGTNLFAGTDLGVFRSTDAGQSWIPLDFGSSLVAASASEVFTTNSEGVWKSSNQAANWTRILEFQAGPFNSSINQLSAHGTFLFLLVTARVSPTSSLTTFRYSPDLGNTWYEDSPPRGTTSSPPFSNGFSSFRVFDGSVFVVRTDGAVFVSPGFGPPGAATVSAASYSPAAVAPESIAATFGSNLALSTESAATNPLPTLLGTTRVRIRDALGAERFAPLLFVSPGQVNYLVPAVLRR